MAHNQNFNKENSGQTSKKIKEIRKRRKIRRLRTFLILAILTLTISLYILGAFNVPLAAAEQIISDITIAVEPGDGFPVSRDMQNFVSSQQLEGGVGVMLNSELLIYSAKGNLLRTVPHNFANPVISASKNSICMYSIGGTRLSVEGRSQTEFTQEYDSPIQLATLSENGKLAVFTKSKLTIYSKYFNEVWTWQAPTQIPLGVQFAENDNNFAVATLNSENALTNTYIYLYNINSDVPTGTIDIKNAVPIKMAYSQNEFIVVCNTFTGVYNAKTGEKIAEYVYDISSVKSVSIDEKANVAILISMQNYPGITKLVIFDKHIENVVQLDVEPNADFVKITNNNVYLAYDDTIKIYTQQGDDNVWQYEKQLQAQQTVLDIIDANEMLYITESEIAPLNAQEEQTQQ